MSIYGEQEPAMQEALAAVEAGLQKIREELTEKNGMDPVDHLMTRIKSDTSMREKLKKRGLPETEESALNEVRDAIGLRVVCGFVDDVFDMAEKLAEIPDCVVVEKKDYIHRAKPNGYRSLHVILRYQDRFYVEIQLRTISMDTWAALEHHMRYKKDIGGNQALIATELKRCADELASTDLSMQTIRDMIMENAK